MNYTDVYYSELAISYLFNEDQNFYDKWQNYLPSDDNCFNIDLDVKNHIIADGLKEGHKLRCFKKTDLDRVIKCTGILNGLNPSSILDLGTGRGNFLNYFLYNQIGNVPITCIEKSAKYVDRINKSILYTPFKCVAVEMDLFDNRLGADVVTAFEILEHIKNWEQALKMCILSANKYVLISVPSKEDNNPEHLHVITPNMIKDAISKFSFEIQVKISGVLNHNIFLLKLKK